MDQFCATINRGKRHGKGEITLITLLTYPLSVTRWENISPWMLRSSILLLFFIDL